MKEADVLSLTLARRLAVTHQRLVGSSPPADSDGIMDIMRDLHFLQIDPMRIVERSHLLVLWSRLGNYDPSDLDKLLWEDKKLFEDWAQTTSIVLTEDYPIFSALKRGFASGNQPRAQRVRSWIDKNSRFQRYILEELRREGPLPSDHFEDRADENWRSTGWTAGRNVGVMLSFLWAKGRIMVAGRRGGRKLWDLTERYLPEWTPRDKLSNSELFLRVAEKSLRALGIATPTHIKQHFIRRCCKNINEVLSKLEAEDRIIRVKIEDKEKFNRNTWYIHANDQALIQQLAKGEWNPRTTLLSPFDNLICDRKRVEQLFSFNYRFEVYTPKVKRKYGSYVMPILYGDRFIGRVDPVMKRKQRQLTINAVYAEPTTSMTKEIGYAIYNVVNDLGSFLGAEEVTYGEHIPRQWKSILC